MKSKLAILAAGVLLAVATLAGSAAAQDQSSGGYTTVTIQGNEKTASNEMGWTKMLNQVEMNSTCTNLETLIHFNTYLDDTSHRGTYYMFQVIWNQNPIQVSEVALQTVDGGAIKIHEQGPEGDVAWKLTVRKWDMPPLGTDMKLTFNVCGDKRGLWEVGSIVMVFDDAWNKVKMTGGVEAEIFNSAKLLVMNGDGPAGGRNGGPGGLLNRVPAPLVPLALGSLGVAAWAARRRQR